VGSRAKAAISVLIARPAQSNAKGVNLGPNEARAFVIATDPLHMLGNDHQWKPAYEPTGDGVNHVDLVNADPAGGCTAFNDNSAAVSPGVAFGNSLSAALSGEAFVAQAGKDGANSSLHEPARGQLAAAARPLRSRDALRQCRQSCAHG